MKRQNGEPLFEHATRASLVRSSDNRRRKPTSKGFSFNAHLSCAPVAFDLSQQYRYILFIGIVSTVNDTLLCQKKPCIKHSFFHNDIVYLLKLNAFFRDNLHYPPNFRQF